MHTKSWQTVPALWPRATSARLHGLLRCEPHWRQGTVGLEIVHEAQAWPADLIVLGSRGDCAIKSALLGSVATCVLHRAPCSVEVVRLRVAILNVWSQAAWC